MFLSRSLISFIVLFLSLSGSVEAAAIVPIDLNTWEQKGKPDNGNWQVSADGQSVYQSINGDPTFFISPESQINTTIRGSIRVDNNWDDDFIGFVFGYQSPNASGNDMNFILFDWKKGNQSDAGYLAQEGFALSNVNGTINNYSPGFWGHTDSPEFNVLAQNNGAGLGWKMDIEYGFEILYQENRIKIDVSGGQFGTGQTIFDIAGHFNEGQFGFYNYSQSSVRYWGFTEQNTPVSVPEPAGILLLGSGLLGLMTLSRKKHRTITQAV